MIVVLQGESVIVFHKLIKILELATHLLYKTILSKLMSQINVDNHRI